MNRELTFSGLMALVLHAGIFMISPYFFQGVQYQVERGPSSMKVQLFQFEHAESKKPIEEIKEEIIETREVIQPEIEKIVQDLREKVMKISVSEEVVSVEVVSDEVVDQYRKFVDAWCQPDPNRVVVVEVLRLRFAFTLIRCTRSTV